VPKVNIKAPGAAKPVGRSNAGQLVETQQVKHIPTQTGSKDSSQQRSSEGDMPSSQGDVPNNASLPVAGEKTQDQLSATKTKERLKQEFSLVNSLITLCRSPVSVGYVVMILLKEKKKNTVILISHKSQTITYFRINLIKIQLFIIIYSIVLLPYEDLTATHI